ncbi:TPA: host cell division inhibitor Icd-like protein [Escherichia coli]|nr:host cell division inhibitor Icd-like protein [Escherichia coli]HDS0124479.1 host cell division inhibitor Icd-like protein [Escherichia coli]HDS0139440.1 host cell division inhibitor Icd-like protein [Escherichia coli]HDS0164194.1 host cell division inhibitor Icd-like protein [Escherichia coli]HDS0408102.1 host cell division inhibitor Icd-like protein [Escherichia coli]
MCNALTVTKRKSAPLPERLCERIAYCAILLTVYEADYSVVVAQSEGADHRRHSTPEMQNILLQNAVGHAVRKAKNFAGGATDAILSGRQVLINLMPDFVLDKTKATAKGRQWVLRQIKLERITNNATFAAGGQCDQCAGLLVGYSYSLALRRWSSSRATATSCPISSAALTPIFSTCASASSEETRGFSPLPSAWRRAISPRTAVITKAAIVSPSVFEFSISSITSWGKRIFFICDLLLMFPVAIRMSGYFEVCTHYTKRCVNKTLDTVAHLNLICMHTNNCGVYTATPRSGGTHAGLLTTNDNDSIEVAMLNHTTHPQGRDSHNLNKYIWRFIALSTAQPRVIHIEATSEQEARQQSPDGCVMVFAARIRQEVHHA